MKDHFHYFYQNVYPTSIDRLFKRSEILKKGPCCLIFLSSRFVCPCPEGHSFFPLTLFWHALLLGKYPGIIHFFAYLRLFLPGPKTLFLDRYYFHPHVCVCLCVYGWVFISIMSKSSWPMFMKLGRMMYNDKRQVLFEDKHNRPLKT